MGQFIACPPCPTIFLNSLKKIRSNRPVSAAITVQMNFQNQLDKLGGLDAIDLLLNFWSQNNAATSDF